MIDRMEKMENVKRIQSIGTGEAEFSHDESKMLLKCQLIIRDAHFSKPIDDVSQSSWLRKRLRSNMSKHKSGNVVFPVWDTLRSSVSLQSPNKCMASLVVQLHDVTVHMRQN